MKKKQITFLLIFSVSVVWGIIFYRIFNSSSKEDLKAHTITSKSIGEEAPIYPLTDTFKLTLNYRDPFLEISTAAPIEVVSYTNINEVSAMPVSVTPSEEAVARDLIEYNGYVINPLNKKIISILTVNGRESMVEEGHLADGVKVIKNYRDSIFVSSHNKTRFVKLK